MPHNPLDGLPAWFFPVLRGIVGGKHNREIADDCGLREHTVEKYASEIYAILECGGRADLIARAYRGEFGNLNDLEEVSGWARGAGPTSEWPPSGLQGATRQMECDSPCRPQAWKDLVCRS
jgi:hypothetical protein